MPITKSAKRALRQSVRRREQNLARAEAVRKSIKEYKKLVLGKRLDDAKAKLSLVYKSLDKAAKTGAIKKNRASRLKSRLTKSLVISSK